MHRHSKIGAERIDLASIDSTNAYAMRLINEGIGGHGLLISAEYQTAGKGQQGNSWQSEEKKNLLFSFILNSSKILLDQQFALNACFCGAIANVLMDDYEVPDVKIKWPNDIYVGQKKIAGILIENIIRGNQWQFAIVGIGLNVNQAHFPLLKNGTSLFTIRKREINLNNCLSRIVKELNNNYNRFLKSPEIVFEEYNQLLYHYKEQISFEKKGELFTGKLLGVNNNGELEVSVDDKKRNYRHKQIELII